MAHRRWAIMVAGAAIFAGMAQPQTAPVSAANHTASAVPADQLVWLRYIAAELRRVHLEVLEDRREIEQNAKQGLERELDSIHSRQNELQQEQGSEVQQAADIEAQLSQSGLSASEREELEARRTDLLSLSPSRFGTAQNALVQKETRLRERLAQQERRIQSIDQQLGELSSGQQ